MKIKFVSSIILILYLINTYFRKLKAKLALKVEKLDFFL